MKLVFYDGTLDRGSWWFFSDWSQKEFHTLNQKYINAGEGISSCLKQFKHYSIEKDAVIQTNLTDLLNFANYNDIYLMTQTGRCSDSEYDGFNYIIKPLQECCDKELRDCHDIRKLYLSGVFSEVYQLTNKKEGL